jgi:uncharacterized protein
MNILLTGATGFVGRALLLRLQRDGHRVAAWVRDPVRARSLLGSAVEIHDQAAGPGAVAAADAVINLAGSPLAGGRFTARRKAAIEGSRIDQTDRLVDAIAAAPRRPGVLVSASAVGFYGDQGDTPLDERSPAGDGYLAQVCDRWERAARRAGELGVRVVNARLGVVLGLGGGLCGRLLPLYRRGLGARLGDGRQFVSFIHLDDLLEALAAAVVDRRYQGTINLVAPQPVRMGELGEALARSVGSRQRLAVPAAALRLALGEAAAVVLASQRVLPRRLEELGFRHAFPTLEGALADLARQLRAIEITHLDPSSPPPLPGARRDYLQQRPPRYLLRSRVELDAPVADVFEFFCSPQNLGLLTPAAMSFRIQGAPAEVVQGRTIDYALRIAGAPLRWRTVVEHWQPSACFVDAQARGPYRSWWHEHHFRSERGGTVMEDRVYYAPPLGILGRLAQVLFVAPQLRQVFGYRSQAIRQRFAALG